MSEKNISPELLEILACPLCQVAVESIEYLPGKEGLKCRECQRIYPVEDGIPIMLVDRAPGRKNLIEGKYIIYPTPIAGRHHFYHSGAAIV